MGPGRVALVILDDHEDWLVGLAQGLRSQPISVHVAYAGPCYRAAIDAAQHAETEQPGTVIAIVDAHQPDGSANLPAVTALASLGIPVAIVTAHAQAADIRSLVAAGAIACIPKADLIDNLDPLLQSVAGGERYPTPELTASLLTSDAVQSLPPGQRQALLWHAAGVRIEAILKECGIDRKEFDAGMNALIEALPHHGTSANSSSETRG